MLSPEAIDTVYSHYKDNPKALVDMFDDQRCQNNGATTNTLSLRLHGPLLSLDSDERFGEGTPQASIPIFSIQYLSSTNGDNSDHPKRPIGQYTNNEAFNDNGGSFDGLSVLDYNNWVTFLNEVADRIGTASNTAPEDTRIQIYEQQFLPVDWISQSVANPWTDERRGGADEDELSDGKNVNDNYAGGDEADSFTLHSGNITIKDFNPSEGDKLLLQPGCFRATSDGDNVFLTNESGATTLLNNTSPSSFWSYYSALAPAATAVLTSPIWLLGMMAGLLSLVAVRRLRKA